MSKPLSKQPIATGPSEPKGLPEYAKAPEPQWVAVASLLRPQGRRGELLADPLSDLLEIFSPGREFRLVLPGAASRPMELEASWQPQGRKAGLLVLKFVGCDSISAAELLGGSQLEIREQDLPALDTDTFLVRDLLGCTLWDGDRSLGTVVDLQYPIAADGRTRIADAPDLLVIHPAASPSSEAPSPASSADSQTAESVATSHLKAERRNTSSGVAREDTESDEEGTVFLVPFVKAWLDEVDLPGKRLRMHLPPGLAE